MTAPAVVRHVEVFYAVATGNSIQLWCDCPIGQTHSYEQWVDQFQRPEQRDRTAAYVGRP